MSQEKNRKTNTVCMLKHKCKKIKSNYSQCEDKPILTNVETVGKNIQFNLQQFFSNYIDRIKFHRGKSWLITRERSSQLCPKNNRKYFSSSRLIEALNN